MWSSHFNQCLIYDASKGSKIVRNMQRPELRVGVRLLDRDQNQNNERAALNSGRERSVGKLS